MFYDCISLINLNLSSFDTTKVIDMSNMFNNCHNIKYLDIPDFSPTNLNEINGMFYNMSSLIYLNIYSLEINDETNTNNAFDKLSSELKICSNKNKMKQYLTSINRNSDCDDNCFKDNTDVINNELKYIFFTKNVEHNNKECFNSFYSDDINDIRIKSYNLSNKNIRNETIFEDMKEVLLDNYNKVSNGQDIEVETQDLLITMTNTYNQKNNKNKNRTTINLGDCQNKLISHYNMSENADLYILKLEAKEEGMKIPKIEYEIYYPLNDTNLIKLDLNECQNTRIDLSIPVDINENEIDKHNPKSNYYTDPCINAVSDSKTDLSIKERKNIFVGKNMTLCEEDCNLVQYNSTTKNVICSCLIKMSLTNIKEIKFDKTKLYKSFIDIKNIANINFMKCYKKVFTKKNLIKNYGFFIYIFIYFLYIICLLLFLLKFYSKLKKEIMKLIKTKEKILKGNNIETGNIKTIRRNSKKTTGIKVKNKNKNNFKKKKSIMIHDNTKYSAKKEFKEDSKNTLNINHNYTQNIHRESKSIFKNKKKLEFTDNELNSLSYQKALIYDKRTYLQYYISLLKANHLLIFSFYFNYKDYNSPIIKMFLFFFYFSVNLAINALFFTDDTMHKIHVDEGKFNFIYQIPITLYSSLISGVISAIIKYSGLSENAVLEIKREKKIKVFKKKKKDIFKTIKMRFILFFIFTFFLLLLFMYYISCFCGIYVNTQIHLINDSLISFAISLIYPLGLFFIPGIFRIPSLRAKDKKQKCLFKFSNVLENLLI